MWKTLVTQLHLRYRPSYRELNIIVIADHLSVKVLPNDIFFKDQFEFGAKFLLPVVGNSAASVSTDA